MDQGLTAAAVKRPPLSDAFLPQESPQPMPEQRLWSELPRQPTSAGRVRVARAALIVLWVSASAGFAWTLYRVLSVEAPTLLQLVFLALSTLCFAWVAVGSASALVGFVGLMLRRHTDSLELPTAPATSLGRTALLFPVYREDAAAVAATIDAMCREIRAADAAGRFDVFILSDTQDAAERRSEQAIYAALRAEAAAPVYVRWRTPNLGKKAGNIQDWVEKFGAAYAYFIILDADSIMSADVLLRLVGGMEANPRAGLIQTVPRLVGGRSSFARLQQFAAATYGPIVAAGLAAWHGHGGNYWGHNAIIRTQAFAHSAGLPRLAGAPPLGGHILSHDFVEAALLRRAGWEVHLVPSLAGSWEGCPPTLGELVIRDRRWAQGNLQHLRLLGVTGLPLLSRVHLAMGAVAYLASPVWAMTLLVGVVLAVQAKYATPAYFGSEVTLFPKWPVFDAQKALALFLATVLIVHLPKLLGAIWALRNARERRRHGGVGRIAAGVLIESVLSTLIAPVLMLTQTSAVASILFGRDAGWGAQRRVGADDGLSHYLWQHRWHTAWGIAGAAVSWSISPAVFAWLSPIALGLLLAAPMARLTARPAARALAQVLATTEERSPPALIESRAATRRLWHRFPRIAPTTPGRPAAAAGRDREPSSPASDGEPPEA
ncbi:MAG TPA: glucans biosynthesis glucosyltransferase MdoH [Hyphomicrobiaceae bacterium]|nr:glucans biosynthesis glucosyltransferase MdoH [Hyphomicrobiaceae bacterium]